MEDDALKALKNIARLRLEDLAELIPRKDGTGPVSRAFVSQLLNGQQTLRRDPIDESRCLWHQLAPRLALRTERQPKGAVRGFRWALAEAMPGRVNLLVARFNDSKAIGLYEPTADGLALALTARAAIAPMVAGAYVVPVTRAYAATVAEPVEISTPMMYAAHVYGVMSAANEAAQWPPEAVHHQPKARVRSASGGRAGT